jgi:hypothetical protein
MILTIKGPYFWLKEPSVYFSSETGKSGIYLWSILYNDKHLIYYVGETGRSFSERFSEHFTSYLQGAYDIYDPKKFIKCNKIKIWNNIKYWKTDSCQRYNNFQSQRKKIFPPLKELINLFYLWIIPMKDDDTRIRRRIEGSLAKYLLSQKGVVGHIQDANVRYELRSEKEPIEYVKFKNFEMFHGFPKKLEY